MWDALGFPVKNWPPTKISNSVIQLIKNVQIKQNQPVGSTVETLSLLAVGEIFSDILLNPSGFDRNISLQC